LCYQTDVAVEVDVLDRVPTPFGLLRYGVAPDHLKMKSLAVGLQRVLDDDRVRLFGDVVIGTDLTVDELRERYDAVVYATGAGADRALGVPGEDLPGSTSAAHFVSWYSGHPDVVEPPLSLRATGVAVLGLGNVAVDVARILVKSADVLSSTDMPDDVLEALRSSPVTDVHLVGRRGPAQARWTLKELRELGELEGVDVVVQEQDLVLSEADEAVLASDSAVARTVAVLRQWVGRPLTGAPRRLHLHFWAQPERVLGDDAVTGLRLATSAGAHGTGTVDLDVQHVVRSVGFTGVPVPGIPFDEATGTIPSDGEGRVLRDGTPSRGEYVAGWAVRGPSGVIGTNRPDGELVAAALLADVADLPERGRSGADALPALLAERGRRPVDLSGWAAIDAAEIARGAAQGRPRAKLSRYDDLRGACLAAVAAP
ncbi:MAG: NADPH-dependent glutamate synthase beta chain-like oxidoreductase, partial [Frankiales bacterium]|nr:NADPH-dependent glutamate synthase beta chain-like oxidoreductase [Frankiales bacterium]